VSNLNYSKESREVCMWFAFKNKVVGTITTYECFTSKETIELLENSELIKFNIEKKNNRAKTNRFIH